ncbi:hypothetical protein [Pedobacter sp. Hv1]|uniref:hypothetical protein n=1 Tax=Pedobacter sp. Hv1 TaxID=1740090 RepID=UPI000B1672A9|nr:hypothetical protein [Pedobacter sp. Hv1]
MKKKLTISLILLSIICFKIKAQTILYSADGQNYKEIKDQEIKNKTKEIPKSNGMLIKVYSPTAYTIKMDGVPSPDMKPMEGKNKEGTALGVIVPGSLSEDGSYIAGTETTNGNALKMKVNFTSPGFYSISSDVVNGIQFFATGYVDVSGQRDIALKANGTPIKAGTFQFQVKFGAGSQTIPITFSGTDQTISTISAIASPVLNGTYKEGAEMNSNNTMAVSVTSTGTGFYDITTEIINGIFFRGTGKVTAVGTMTVTLKAYGTPIQGVSTKYTVKTNGGISLDQNVPFAKAPNDYYVYSIPNTAKKLEFSDPSGTDVYTIQLSGGDEGERLGLALANTSYINYIDETYGTTRKTFKVTPYGLLMNAKINGKDYLYGGPNYVHIFLDEMGSPLMTTIPQGIPEMQYVVHIIYNSENAGRKVSYGINVTGGTFTGGNKIENGKTNPGELTGTSDPIFDEYTVLIKTTDSDFDFEIRRFENGTVTKKMNYTLTMTKSFTTSISVGLLNTKLKNPTYSLVTDPADNLLKLAKETEGRNRGFGTVFATLYTSPITLIKYYVDKKKISQGRLNEINNPVADFQLHSKDYLYMRPVWERIYPTVGVGLTDKIFQNLFFGLNWEFARGGSIFIGGHYGKVNVFNAPEGFEFQKTNLTADQYNLYQNIDWRTDWAFGASLDFSIITNLFK